MCGMIDNENIKTLENLHNRILNDTSFLAKVNHGELSALFHIRRILELQDAEIERLQEENKRIEGASIVFNGGVKYVKSEAYREFAERFCDKFIRKTQKYYCRINDEHSYKWTEGFTVDDVLSNIDSTLKELTENNDKG